MLTPLTQKSIGIIVICVFVILAGILFYFFYTSENGDSGTEVENPSGETTPVTETDEGSNGATDTDDDGFSTEKPAGTEVEDPSGETTPVTETDERSNGATDADDDGSSAEKLAEEAYAILDEHCSDCHNEFGYAREAFVLQHENMIDKKVVIEGKPEDSELYTVLVESRMPPEEEERLTPQERETIQRWIIAGAPNWEPIPETERSFITTEAMLETIHTHVNSLTDFNRAFARYFTLTHLYNAGASDDNLDAYRMALSKLVNSLSWDPEVIEPTPIDSEKTILYIDLRHYDWHEKSDKWYKIQQAYPYRVQLDSSTYRTVCGETACDLPFVRADWFIAEASLPPLYHEILDLPETDKALETRLGVDVEKNIKSAPGVNVWRAGFTSSGVSRHNRIVERHKSMHGAYWKSYDFEGSDGKKNILEHPLDFEHAGGEIIFNLPNGLQAYYLSDANGNRLDQAPTNIVSDKVSSDALGIPEVRNGLSCMGCHTEGMMTFKDEVLATIMKGPDGKKKDQVKRLYAEKGVMEKHVEKDKERYRRAIEDAGCVFGGKEPILLLVKQFEGSLTVDYAAAEVGLKTDVFLEKIREDAALSETLNMFVAVKGGTVQRDTWESQFGTLVSIFQKDSVFIPPETEPSLDPPPNMVLIPTGEFQMGSDSGKDNEKPVHSIYVDDFYIDTYEVTNAEYKKFVDANPEWQKDKILDKYHDGNYLAHWDDGNNYPSGKDEHPVVYVSWYAAMAYAAWVDKRLPTEAEWEKAARGGSKGQKYPWGDDPDPSKANYKKEKSGRSAPTTGRLRQSKQRKVSKKTDEKTVKVGTYPAYPENKDGLYDMAGNVREWCLDEFVPSFYKNSPPQNPIAGDMDIKTAEEMDIETITNNFAAIKDNIDRVCRGGSWDDSSIGIRNAHRFQSLPKRTNFRIGFRCVKSR